LDSDYRPDSAEANRIESGWLFRHRIGSLVFEEEDGNTKKRKKFTSHFSIYLEKSKIIFKIA
jgi:hypothetical protein